MIGLCIVSMAIQGRKDYGDAMSNLTPRQEKFLLALLSEPTVNQACRTAGISPKTGRNYLRNEVFSEAYKKMRREIMKQTTARLQFLALKATQELEKILDNPKASPYAKINAAQLVLDKAYKGLELEDLEERIERLEQITENNK